MSDEHVNDPTQTNDPPAANSEDSVSSDLFPLAIFVMMLGGCVYAMMAWPHAISACPHAMMAWHHDTTPWKINASF